MYDTGLRHDSGYISLVKTGIFSQTVGNARLASLQIDAGSLKVVNTLLLAGELATWWWAMTNGRGCTIMTCRSTTAAFCAWAPALVP